MRPKIGRIREAIRYSEAFKRSIALEAENTGCTFLSLQLKYGVKGRGTIKRWVLQYGQGLRGRIIRVETPDETNELARLRREVNQLKVSLADAHVELALEKAFLNIACDRMGESVEGFKKKNPGKQRTKR